MPVFCHCLWVQTHKYHVANNELACCGLPEAMGSPEPGLTTEQIKHTGFWPSYVALSINGFLDCVHHPIFNKVYNILQTWSVPTLKWKVAEIPTWLEQKETTIISHWIERVTVLFALVLVFTLQCVVPTILVECVWNVMAHAQKPDFVFWRKGRVHLNQPVGVSSVDYWQPRRAHQRK